MNFTEYSSYDGLGLAELVKKGQTSQHELALTALRAIAVLNPQLNAVIESYETAVSRPGPAAGSQAVFSGVPFLLKDIGSHDANVKFELGSRLTAGLMSPPYRSELVNRFYAAGVNVVGRTTVPELGSSCTTESKLHGATRNPWNLERTAGGSSGGAAAAVASGMVPIAHANDAGGSIRWPAACCGLFGLKPSRNLNPVGPDVHLALNGIAAEHILSKSVRDTAAMLDVTAGPDVGAWCYTPRYQGSYLEALQQSPGKLRIGINLTPIFPPTNISRIVSESILETGRLCESLGHSVEMSTFNFDHEMMLEAFSIIWSTSLANAVEGLSALTGRPANEDYLEPHVLVAVRDAMKLPSTKVLWALDQMNHVARAYGAYFEKYDVMLTPAGSDEPFEIGKIAKIPTASFYDWFVELCKNCPFLSTANIAGIPAMSVPLSWSTSGLPIGSHFLGKLGSEKMLLQLAAQLEQAKPWIEMVPPHHISKL